MTTTSVSSVDQLYAALSTSKGGDIIELAPGEYDRVSIHKGRGFDVRFDGPVTIRSADPGNPAVIREMELNGVSNLTFDSIHFDYDAAPGAKIMERPFEILRSDNIAIKNSVFDGDLAEGVSARSDGFATGLGLGVRKSSNVTVENNEFFNFYRGLSLGESTDVVVRGNDIHSIRCDGLTVVKMVGVLIEDNFIHDFARNMEAGDHSDMIQMWNINSTYPSTDITIRNNRLDIGNGDHTQTILIGNQAVGKLPEAEKHGMFYKNITIEGNLIINSHLHGITVGETDGLTISNNILLHSSGGSSKEGGYHQQPLINLKDASVNVTVTDNIAARFPDGDGKPDWQVSGNQPVQDYSPGGKGYYASAQEFLDRYLSGEAGAQSDPVQSDPAAPDSALARPAPTLPQPVDGAGATPALPSEEADSFGNIYRADFSALAKAGKMRDGAVYDAEVGALSFDGDRGAVSLGKLDSFADTRQIMVDMDILLNRGSDGGQLFNNHMRLAASVSERGLSVQVATEDEGFKNYKIDGLDLGGDKAHRLQLILDREEDHLQIVLNGEIILEDRETDFVARDGMHNWGWSIGNYWKDSFDGTMTSFGLSDQAQFVPSDFAPTF